MTTLRSIWPVAVLHGLGAVMAQAQTLPVRTITREWEVTPETGNFSSIRRLLVAPDGRVFVMQQQDNLFRVVSPDGKSQTFGHAGDGPGEFRQMDLTGWAGEMLWVGDTRLRRISLFDRSGSLVRSFPFLAEVRPAKGPAQKLPYSLIIPEAVYADGTLLVAPFLGRTPTPPFWEEAGHHGQTPLMRVDAKGVMQGVAGWMPRMGCSESVTNPDGSGMGVGIPFCSNELQAFSADGRLIAVLTRAPGENAAYDILVTRFDGSTVFARQYRYTEKMIPARTADSARAALIRVAGTDVRRAALYRSMTIPRSYSPIVKLLIGQDGTIWLEEWSEGKGHAWRVLSAAGVPLFTVALPAGTVLAAAERGRIWSVVTSEDGEQGLVVHRLSGR